MESQMEMTIYAKFLRSQNSINITGTGRLKVFLSRNIDYVCSTIWTHKFSRISHCGFVTFTKKRVAKIASLRKLKTT